MDVIGHQKEKIKKQRYGGLSMESIFYCCLDLFIILLCIVSLLQYNRIKVLQKRIDELEEKIKREDDINVSKNIR